MSDELKENDVLIWYHNEQGEKGELTASDVLAATETKSGRDSLHDFVESSYSEVTSYGGGLIEIDFHPKMTVDGIEGIPLPTFPNNCSLNPGRYFVQFGSEFVQRGFTVEEAGKIDSSRGDGLVLATSESQALGDCIEMVPATLTPRGGETDELENPPGEPLELWLIKNSENGSYATFLEVLSGLSVMAVAQIAIDHYGLKTSEDSNLLPLQDIIKPRQQIDPNSKLANKITDVGLGETTYLDVSGKNERAGSVLTSVTLEYEGEGITLSKPITQYDREVHNAVTTLWKAGNRSFTTRQVWEVLSGSKNPPSDTQSERIEESLDKQRFTRAMVDFSQEARGRQLELDGEPVTNYVIDSYMLPARKEAIRTANGREVDGYTIVDIPVLYRHSAAFGQLVSYPSRLLDTASAGQNTDENIIIKKYLLRRIGQATGKSKLSPRIKYSSVYEKVGIKDPDKKQRKRINDYVLACLELWKKDGHIKGYEEYKEGRTRAGVDLVL